MYFPALKSLASSLSSGPQTFPQQVQYAPKHTTHPSLLRTKSGEEYRWAQDSRRFGGEEPSINKQQYCLAR